MKKLFLLPLLAIGFISCEKDEIDALNTVVDANTAAIELNAAAIDALAKNLDAYKVQTDAAISNLGDALVAETVARQEADAAITSVVDALTLRVTTNEGDISDLFTEVDRIDATIIENFNTLIDEINANTTLIGNVRTALEDAIATEEAARIAGDNATASSLGAQISSLSTALTGLSSTTTTALNTAAGLLQGQIDSNDTELANNLADITSNSTGISEGFTATYQLLASSLLGDIATAKSFLGSAERKGLIYTFDSQATMTGISTGKGMFKINLGDIDSTVLSDIQKSRLEVVYDRAMENSDAYSRLLDAVRNFGWDVFTDVEQYTVGGNEFSYESSLVSNLTVAEFAGDGAYAGASYIEELMVGNVGAVRTFSFLSVAIGEGELYNYPTTIIDTTPPVTPYQVVGAQAAAPGLVVHGPNDELNVVIDTTTNMLDIYVGSGSTLGVFNKIELKDKVTGDLVATIELDQTAASAAGSAQAFSLNIGSGLLYKYQVTTNEAAALASAFNTNTNGVNADLDSGQYIISDSTIFVQ